MWARDETLSIGSQVNTSSKNKSIVRGLAYHRKVYKLLGSWQKISAPEQRLYVEPWLRHSSGVMFDGKFQRKCQPDAVLVEPDSKTGIAIEVKLNWKDGRDEKLIRLYLQATAEAFGLDAVFPALITSNVRGLEHKPLLGLGALRLVDAWNPGDPTPVILVP